MGVITGISTPFDPGEQRMKKSEGMPPTYQVHPTGAEVQSDGSLWFPLAVFVCLGVTILRLSYIGWLCPYDLAQDEAHYWDWSRNLDWSYYSKGPLVAWLIALSDTVCSPLIPIFGFNQEIRVRLFAPFFGGAFLLAIFVFTRQVMGNGRLALIVMVSALTLPPVAVAGLLMTIDAPYTCLWAWSMVLAHRVLVKGGLGYWLLLGLLVGIGILAKYTMVLFLPSLFVAMLADRTWRGKLLSQSPWLGLAVTGLCCTPILLWNLGNDFVTFRHVGNLAGVDKPSSGIRWLGPLNFLGGQAALLLVFWLVAWLFAMISKPAWMEPDQGKRLAWWLSAPTFLVFLAFSLKTGGGEVNWPVTAYLAAAPLVAALFLETTDGRPPILRNFVAPMLVFGSIVVGIIHATPVIQPLIAKALPVPDERNPFPIRKVDPSCRLMGWRDLASKIDEERSRNPGLVIAVHRWSSAGLLGFYCKGRPKVECLGAALGDRHSQYDLWPNPVSHPDRFIGKDFVVIDAPSDLLKGAFKAIGMPVVVTGFGPTAVPVARWSYTIASGYKGFDKQSVPPRGW